MHSPRLLLSIFCIASYFYGTCLAFSAIDSLFGTNNPPQHVLAESSVNSRQNLQSSPPKAQEHASQDALQDMIDALEVLQEQYFELWQGIWPTAIDWTSAVLGTYLSAALTTLSKSLDYTITSREPVSTTVLTHENLINQYFSQLVSFYFGQDAFALRTEAYDDMLWVVLGWLESIKFIHVHSSLHYSEYSHLQEQGANSHKSWHGRQWISSFAHRARIFWELASQGWDTSLCEGGMLWSPYTAPYKNAITNELFITASISMYLYFPGDQNTSPFMTSGQPIGTQEPKYLAAAVEGYKWLKSANMTNHQRLYTDGFHISGWERNPPRNHTRHTRCDLRNEMVYTYNQGVLLSGQRGLWEATAARSYLEDGHQLVQDIINATGYDLKHDSVYWDQQRNNDSSPQLAPWHGLGRRGVIEDLCDSHGQCSQDAQTFKGIFFHHLSLFCSPLPPHFLAPGETFDVREYHDTKTWHEKNCKNYAKWIKRNANAAVSTRTEDGKYGMWWGAPRGHRLTSAEPRIEIPAGAVDYRNRDLPRDKVWVDGESPLWSQQGNTILSEAMQSEQELRDSATRDANDRGRGRTVETQGGAVAVLRALWEIAHE
ncbi:MAG: hypothetical protein M1818_006367 [Claussenomyces sp. TS43310]|nr:MAG: hypothetical protein M1818_006367 [Claussenomyces sp. TS43310]